MARVIWPSAVVILLTVRAAADGMFAGRATFLQGRQPSSSAQKAVLIRDGPEEVLLLQTTYHGPAAQFAWVIPVPARPSAVTPADARFIAEVFRRTEPVLTTYLGQLRRSLVARLSGLLPFFASKHAGTGQGMGEGMVQVLAHMTVGDFDAVVLAAGAGDTLRHWLVTNGYRVPHDPGGILDTYARQRWVFVALKLQQTVVAQRPVLQDVPPVSLRFPYDAGRLVYPLAISRLSAPPMSTVLLCLVADEPYVSQTVPTRWVERRATLAPGQTYADLRRRMARPEEGAAAFCEAMERGALRRLYGSSPAPGTVRSLDLEKATVSRHFLLLRSEEMGDLVFAEAPRDGHRDYRVLVARKGRPSPQAAQLLASRGCRALVRPEDRTQAAETPADTVRTDDLPPPPRRLTALEADLLFGLYMVLIGGLLAAAWRYDRGMTGPVIGLIVLTAPLAVVLLNTPVSREAYAVTYGVSRTLDQVERAAGCFREDTGCYPRTVADLASRTAPETGLDASGNPVPIRGWRGPYLSNVPSPIRAEPGVILDPLNTRLADLAGLQTTVAPITADRAWRLQRAK